MTSAMPVLAAIARRLPWLGPAAAAMVGACIGSFLNVVILRLPAGRSIVRPRSHCACGAPIGWRDNLPVVSWLLLRGRARCCGRPISARYPAIELLTALLFLAAAIRLPPAESVCADVLLAGLVAAAAIDLDHLMIPDSITIGLAVAGVVLSALVPALHGEAEGFFALDSLRAATSALLGLLIGSGLVLWIAILAEAAIGQEAMGFGDVKLTGAIGAFCGWHGAVFAVFGGAVAGTLWFGLTLPLGRRAAPRREEGSAARAARVPFGPMLAVAAAAYLLALRGPVDGWFARLAALY